MKPSKYIDHTILKPNATSNQIIKLCEEAVANDFASVCINPCWIPTAKAALAGSDVKLCVVVGFPLGAMTTEAKVFETKDAIEKGAKDHDDIYVTNEIRQIKNACGNITLKVIIETCLLTDEEKVRACKDAEAAGADFVKTSTGFSTGGATVGDVKLMKETVGDRLKVKASGGIRTKEDFKAMIEAGADRIGASAGVELIKE